MEDTILVTGADSKYFLMSCLLYQSVKLTSLAKNFFVLDFGFKENEKAFFRGKGILVDAQPALSGSSRHEDPYVIKAKVHDFIADLRPSSNVIWIDSDIILNKGVDSALRDLLDDMATNEIAVAASPELKISDVLMQFPHLNFDLFKQALSERQISTESHYYNSGFIIFRSRDLLKEWSDLAKSTPFYALFDQNLFNLIIHSGVKARPLPRTIWNFHGSDFDRENVRIIRDATEAALAVLHVTSSKADHYVNLGCRFAGSPGYNYDMRLLDHKPFLDYQFSLLEQFVSSEHATLAACNLIPSHWPAEKFPVEWNISRNQPCPCKSEKRYKHCHGSA